MCLWEETSNAKYVVGRGASFARLCKHVKDKDRRRERGLERSIPRKQSLFTVSQSHEYNASIFMCTPNKQVEKEFKHAHPRHHEGAQKGQRIFARIRVEHVAFFVFPPAILESCRRKDNKRGLRLSLELGNEPSGRASCTVASKSTVQFCMLYLLLRRSMSLMHTFARATNRIRSFAPLVVVRPVALPPLPVFPQRQSVHAVYGRSLRVSRRLRPVPDRTVPGEGHLTKKV